MPQISREALLMLLGHHLDVPAEWPHRDGRIGGMAHSLLERLTGLRDQMVWPAELNNWRPFIIKRLRQHTPALAQWDGHSDPTSLLGTGDTVEVRGDVFHLPEMDPDHPYHYPSVRRPGL